MKLTRKTFLADDTLLEKMELLRKHNSLLTLTEVFRLSVNTLYNSTIGNYKFKADPNLSTNVTVEEVAIKGARLKQKVKQITEEEEQKLRIEKKINMCKDLFNGEMSEDNKYCVFTSYGLKDDTEIKLPVNQIDPIVAQNSLFVPSMESIFKNRKDVRKIFSKVEHYKQYIVKEDEE